LIDPADIDGTPMEKRGPEGSQFYRWHSLDGRLQELHNRLTAWGIAGDQVPEIFKEAGERFVNLMPETAEIDELLADRALLLHCLESVLDDFDQILRLVPQTSRCPECGLPTDADSYCVTTNCDLKGQKVVDL
jgi:hypothetical protein